MAEIQRIETVAALPEREREGHKGRYGTVLVVGGSRGMIGAPSLAANAALRGGAGLVQFAAPQAVQLTIAGLVPCATSHPLACDGGGMLTADCLDALHQAVDSADVLAVGPGMGRGDGPAQVVADLLTGEKPIVLDADGLNNLSTIDDWPARRSCPLILTPHPGEFSRLTGKDVKEIQSDRESAAAEAAGAWAGAAETDAPLVLVLKGAGTVVTDAERLYVNESGNPGMASGGTGDVLTGLLAAIWGQGLAAFDAACFGVFAHGLAGDYGADELGEVSLMATDLLDFLPDAVRDMQM